MTMRGRTPAGKGVELKREAKGRRWWIPLVAALLLLPVVAEEPAENDGEGDEVVDSEYVESIEVDRSHVPTSNTIATKMAVDLQHTPANVGVVNRNLFEEQRAFMLSGTLPNVSSVHVESGTGVHDYFLVRGFDSLNGALVMTDGAREPEATFYSTYNVEGVEVLKGPSGFLYGPGPLSGAVNMVRKQPVPANFVELGLTAGSFNTAQGTLDWNIGSETTAFRLNGVYNQSDHYRDDKKSDQWAVNPSFTWNPNDQHSLTFNLEAGQANYKPDAGIPLYQNELPDVDRKTSYQSPYDTSDQDVARFQFDWQYAMSDRVTLRNKLYYRQLDWISDGTIFAGTFAPQPGLDPVVARAFLALDDSQKFAGNQFEAVMNWNTGSVEHQLLTGLELISLNDEYTLGIGQLPFISLYDPEETAVSRPPTVPIDLVDPSTPGAGDATSTVIAPYVVDQMKFSERFQLMVGLRYDDIDSKDDVNDVSRDDSELSPMLGVVYAPTKNTSIYGNAGQAYAPASPRVVGDLSPEESREYEIGWKQRMWNGRGRLGVAVYDLERKNIPIPDELGFTQQAGDQQSKGFEIDFAAEPIERLSTFVAYSYTDAELTRFTETGIVGFDPNTFEPIFGTIDRSGNRPAFVPEHLARIWVSYRLKAGFGFGGGLRYFSDQYIAPDNQYKSPGAVVADAMAYWDLKGWRLRLNLKNLTNTEYETRGFGSESVRPANPFQALVGFDVRF